MLRVVSTVAVEAAGPYAGSIARVLPQLRSHMPGLIDAPAFSDPAEERMRLQSSLAAWFVAVADRRPLCILVDDLQRADEASAATLAALALASPEHALFVAVAMRTDEDVRAPHPIRVIAGADTRMTLDGLDRAGVEQLVRGLFGDVPNLPRLADVLHRVGRGNPMHTMELVHILVRDEYIRFVDGLWLIRDLEEAQLAEALAPAIDRRIETLGPEAKGLAEVLAVHGEDVDLGTLTRLAEPGKDPEQTFAALDELMEAEVLSVGSDRHRFRHDGIREAILRTIDESRMRELHARVGRALDRPDLEEADELRIGWHLFRGGDSVRGGELLEAAGTKLYLAQSFTEAIPPLQAALSVREQRPGAVRSGLAIEHMLLLAGCMSDRRVAIEYIDSVIEGYRIHGGIRVAERLGPWLGRPLALAVGLSWRMLLWLLALPSRRGPFPFQALGNFFVAVGFSATVYSLSYDIANLRRLLALARPLALFRRGLNYGIFLLTESLLAFPLGRFGRVRECANEMISLIRRARDSRYMPISSLDLRTGEGGCRLMLALIDVAEQDPAYVEELERLRELDLRYFELGIHQARLAFHRSRGEEEKALRVLADVEVLLVQLGSAWQMETWLAAASALAYGMNRDVVGLKRAIEDLRAMVERGLAFEGALELTRGEYHRERGELDASLECLERARQIIDEEVQIFWQPALAAMADTLVAMGDFDRAIDFARRGYELGLDPDVGQFANRVRSARAWALAEAGLGELHAAAARLDEELQAAGPRASPCLSGSLHEARAIVARQIGDRPAYDLHRLAAERLFSASKNPALMARVERLLDSRAERALAPTFTDDRSTAVLEGTETVVRGTSQLVPPGSGQDDEAPSTTDGPSDPDSSSDSIEVSR